MPDRPPGWQPRRLEQALAVMVLNIGLIGYGLGGSTFHAPLISAADRLRLVAVASSRKLDLPDSNTKVTSADALIADPAIDLVAISTPHKSHHPLARAALSAGKHVVVDKPFTLTSAEAQDLINLAAANDCLVIPFHNRRWDGDYLTVRQFIDSGRLGEIARFDAYWDRFRPGPREGWKEVPEEGSGLLNDLAPHLIDQALQLFGWPEALGADIAVQRSSGMVDDYFELVLYYGSRRILLGGTQIGLGARPRFAVHGTGGSLVKYGLDPQEDRLKAGDDPRDPAIGVDDPGQFATWTAATGAAERIATLPGNYLGFYQAVADAIIQGAPPPVDPADARDGLRIIELARQSSNERRVIDASKGKGEKS